MSRTRTGHAQRSLSERSTSTSTFSRPTTCTPKRWSVENKSYTAEYSALSSSHLTSKNPCKNLPVQDNRQESFDCSLYTQTHAVQNLVPLHRKDSRELWETATFNVKHRNNFYSFLLLTHFFSKQIFLVITSLSYYLKNWKALGQPINLSFWIFRPTCHSDVNQDFNIISYKFTLETANIFRWFYSLIVELYKINL